VSQRVLVTGANGFVGRILCEALASRGLKVRAATRTPASVADENVVIGQIGSHTDWSAALEDVQWVFHLAARVHMLGRPAPADLETYREVNARGTAVLATAAARAAVGRFVYLSSIKVNGEGSRSGCYSRTDAPQPADAYAVSKWEGELAVRDAAAGSAMQWATVRSPLVYGAGVGANFLRLIRWVDRERLLPFGAVNNRRSLISVWNLADVLIRAAEHPAAASKVWLVADGPDLSTPQLVRTLARALERQPRLLAVPPLLLRTAAALTGQRAAMARLCGSLAVDSSATRSGLDWTPPLSLEEGVRRTVAWYRLRGEADAR
jgi:nucleoside-diphosphate-sugar epimerase